MTETPLTIIVGVIVFTGAMAFITSILLYAGSKLIQAGTCAIKVNDDEAKSFQAQPGSMLLSALAEKNVYLPSACGGGGTCGMCKCQVVEGGGQILATETSLVTRKEAKDHWRLSCQVKVREDLSITLPDEFFSIKKFEATVASNDNVATYIKELVLDIPDEFQMDFKAGQYIQIYIPPYRLKYTEFDIGPEYRKEWEEHHLLELKAHQEETIYRAYSMANYPAERNQVKLNVRIATPPWGKKHVPPGIASSYIFNLKPGQKVDLSGPYGDFFIRETEKEKIYVGGGAGMAPMRSHLFHLFNTLKTGVKVQFWYGARSVREMFYDEEFKAIAKAFPNFSYNVALSEPQPEDNWTGPKGFIHQVLLDNYLKHHAEPEECEYYLCGPPIMIDCVTAMLDNLGVEEEAISFDVFG